MKKENSKLKTISIMYLTLFLCIIGMWIFALLIKNDIITMASIIMTSGTICGCSLASINFLFKENNKEVK